jgi:uncharacterized membrane protein
MILFSVLQIPQPRRAAMRPNRLQHVTRILIALSFAAFGAHQLIYGDFVTRVIGTVPSWIPFQTFWADATGLLMIVAAIALVLEKRNVAIVLGVACLISAFLTHLPPVLAQPTNAGRWVFLGKGIAISGCAFTVAGSLGARLRALSPHAFILYGRCALGAFMILSGILHFMLREYVVILFPSWIPLHMFFTLFAGVLLIAGGIGIILPFTTRMASLLSGIMILAWVPLIHIPLALKNLKNPKESVPIFEALAFGCLALLAYASETKTDSNLPQPQVDAEHSPTLVPSSN